MAQYVNNKSLLKAILTYRELLANGDRKSTAFRRAENEMGGAFELIAKNMLRMPKFYKKYAFADEMVREGVYDCAKYAHNFDPKRSENPNPFSYFTQVCFNAFIRRISKEKKDYRTRQSLILQSGIIDQVDVTQEGDDTVYANAYLSYLKEFIDTHSYNANVETPVITEKKIVVAKPAKLILNNVGLFE